MGKVVGGVGKVGIGIVKQILPIKYRFTEDILEDLIDFLDDLEKPAQQKREAALRRAEELRRKQAESLKKLLTKKQHLSTLLTVLFRSRMNLNLNFLHLI